MKLLTSFLLCNLLLFQQLSSLNVIAEETLFISEINFRGSLSSSRCIKPEAIQNYEENTSWCGKDEWLELYNPTKNDVNLDSYTLEVRGGKVIKLSGIIKSNGFFIIGFSQNNFLSIIKPDLTSYNLLYLSSESDRNPANHNITAVLKNDSDVIDILNVNPSFFDPNYLQARGVSFERNSKQESWLKSANEFFKDNFGTPGFLINTIEAKKETSNDFIVDNQAFSKIPDVNSSVLEDKTQVSNLKPTDANNQTQTASKTSLQTGTQSLQKNILKTEQVKENEVPKEDLEKQFLKEISNQIEPISLQSRFARNEASVKTHSPLKPMKIPYLRSTWLSTNNLNYYRKSDLKRAFLYSQTFNLELLNLFLLTGIVIKLITRKVNSKKLKEA